MQVQGRAGARHRPRGAYKAGLAVEAKRSAHRTVYRVVGHDKKTMLVESKTGNLVRALKAVR